ncbi:MAG: class I SAM-dependent methyltransferase [Chloroflexi bacterium]|nr:class I SAM-dependent methyltransferase [Chloroflexota bacterium]
MTHIPARRNYDRLSRLYDWFAGSEKSVTEAGLRLLDPQPGERALEIGPGTGHGLVWLSQSGIRPVGLDLSAGMLAQARAAGKRSRTQADLCQGDALSLPFPNFTFHAIFLSFTIELFSDIEIPLLLAACACALKPGGRLGVVSLAQEESRMVQAYEWTHRRWPTVVDCRPIPIRHFLHANGYQVREARRERIWGLPIDLVTAYHP